MFKDIKKNKKGVTLLELTVAVAIFSFMILSITQIFKMVIDGQRNAIAAQNMQESMRYALEVMSKEIRMARKATGSDCSGGFGSGKIYKTIAASKLKFKNYNGNCVNYYLDSERIKIDRGASSGYITPDEISVSSLEFIITDNIGTDQSMVTMKMDIEAVGKAMHKQSMKLQTTVSSRYYE